MTLRTFVVVESGSVVVVISTMRSSVKAVTGSAVELTVPAVELDNVTDGEAVLEALVVELPKSQLSNPVALEVVTEELVTDEVVSPVLPSTNCTPYSCLLTFAPPVELPQSTI